MSFDRIDQAQYVSPPPPPPPPPPEPELDAQAQERLANGQTPYSLDPAYHPQLGSLLAANDPSGGIVPATSFDAQVRGQDARAIDMDLALISQDVYVADSTGIPGWQRLDRDQLAAANIDPDSLSDPNTGLQSAIYTDGNGRYALAFAGTDPTSGGDWRTNFGQALGFQTAQYNQALAIAQDAKDAFGDNLVVTGHSLGGGLASAAALSTDSAAVTFNASGLSDATIRQAGLDPVAARASAEAGQVRRYAVENEVLTGVQESGALRGAAPDAVGHKIELNDPTPAAGIVNGLPLIGEGNSVRLHLMGSVLQALQNDQPWNNPGGDNLLTDAADYGRTLANEASIYGGNIATEAGNFVQDVKDGHALGGAIEFAGDVAGNTIELAGDALGGGVQLAGSAIERGGEFISDQADRLGDAIDRGSDTLADGIGNVATRTAGSIAATTDLAGDYVHNAAGGGLVGDALRTGVNVAGGVAEFGVRATGAIAETGTRVLGAVANGLVSTAGAVVERVTDFAGEAVTLAGRAIDGVADLAGQAVDKVTDFAGATVNVVTDGARTVGNAINRAMPWNW